MLDEEFFDVSDEDDNILRYIRHINKRRKDRVVRPRPNHFAIWDEKEFIARFRLSKGYVFASSLRNQVNCCYLKFN